MKTLKYFFLIIITAIIFIGCETIISPELQNAEPLLVVDAWVTNMPGSQTIILSQTQPYFENKLPPPVSNAIITVIENGSKTYNFLEDPGKPGYYSWTPVGNEVFGMVGLSYKLTVQVGTDVYESTSKMGPVPPIDSIQYKKNEPDQQNPDFYLAQFFAKDVIGLGDTYWIKTFKNGIFLNKPSEINVAYDAGFDAGGPFFSRIENNIPILVDFIPPIRNRINPNDTDENDNALSPYIPGDSVMVEIHSITLQSFAYLRQLAEQTNRPGGFSELFSKPLANVSTNIVNPNPNGKKAVGFFNVAAVSSLGKKFKK